MNSLINYGASERFFTEATLYPGFALARVISQYKDYYKIITEGGERLAEVSGKFRYLASTLSDYPAVGDFVMVDPESMRSGNAIIHSVLARKSAFQRLSAGEAKEAQVVAANIDVVFLCMSLNNNYSLSRLERYLSVAWSSGATPVVVLTKADLCDQIEAVLSEISQIALGADVVTTSSFDLNSYAKLLPYLKKGMTTSFIGSSGVGKSTLINCLAGENLLATSEIGEDDKGRHTTTRRELLLLPNGGVVIDTPGMRELGAESVNLSKSFSDIDALMAKCRFHDCTHTNEPGCAVRKSIEAGELDQRRLESYQKLKKEARYDGLSSRQIENEKLKAMGGKKQLKRMMDEIKKKNR